MILVVGATGQLGGLVTRRLLQNGWPVRVLVRKPSPAATLAGQGLATDSASLIAAGAQPVYGNLTAPASLVHACRGVHTVITTANAASRPGETVEQVDLWGNRHLIDAAVTAGVRRYLFVSAQFADAHSPSDFLRAKAETEVYLQASGLDYTILAPNAFMDTWISGLVLRPIFQERPVTLVGSGARRHAFIAMQDVAAFILAALEHPAAHHRRLVLGGPEVFSFLDAVTAVAQLLNRSIPVVHVAPGAPIPGLPEEAWSMAAWLDTFDSPVEMAETAGVLGVPLTSLEAFIRRQLAQAA
ncbi:SDR family oxidoreductase [Litorilinea aerophila]|uniref:SDR family oxidoreductase n=1 Tax=Litorilinea aerophila TaxID=1204385 RepID=A0A540VB71_9CHLR|nr:SDR family oxidoreductase [Litorilinea aerophila]MCC9078155.1 SDR family oxidoreductase [Litorilinea aerophila]